MRKSNVLSMAGTLLLVISAIGLAACSAKAPASAEATAAASTGPQLYVLDCGTISPMDPEKNFNLKKEEIKGDAHFVSPCYLIVHPKGTLVWDLGQVPDAKIKDDGSEAVE